MFVSHETLKTANSGRERAVGSDTKLKNASASNNNEKPAWLITYLDSIGNDYNLSNNTTDEEELKQASNSNNNEMPNWLITYRNSIGQ